MFSVNEQVRDSYNQVQRQILAQRLPYLARFRLPNVNQELIITSADQLSDVGLWAYISAQAQLDMDFSAQNLMPITVTTGQWVQDQQLNQQAQIDLQKLFRDADIAGEPLIVTSAYRTQEAQQAIFQALKNQYGISYATNYVALPQSSEHQTGLAVDLTSYSPACQKSFAGCQLKMATQNWLLTNAYRYGFINRYPANRQDQTGVGFEPWHYRYLGPTLATMVYESGLTFDEVYSQMAKLVQEVQN